MNGILLTSQTKTTIPRRHTDAQVQGKQHYSTDSAHVIQRNRLSSCRHVGSTSTRCDPVFLKACLTAGKDVLSGYCWQLGAVHQGRHRTDAQHAIASSCSQHTRQHHDIIPSNKISWCNNPYHVGPSMRLQGALLLVTIAASAPAPAST